MAAAPTPDASRLPRTARAHPRLRWLLACLALAATAAVPAVSATTAAAKPVPIVKPPAGGGAITYQTFDVPVGHLAAMGQPGDAIESQGLVPRPVGAFGMKSITFDLVDAHTGQSIPRMDAWLHHFVIAQMGPDDPACPNHVVSGYHVAPMVGTGQERTPIAFPDPYAILVGSGGWWGAVWHVMNMTDTPMDVKITYTIGMQTGATAANTRGLTPFWSDSHACPAGTTWDVAGNGGLGSVETYTKTYTMPKDGIVVGIGGHLHGGGIDMVTKHQDGTTMCVNTAHYMAGMELMDGMIESISACAPHDTVTKGEQLSVTSHYDNGHPHAEVMGMSVMYIWFGTQPPAPAAPSTTTTTAPADPTTTVPDPDTPGTAPANAVEAVPTFTG